MCYMHVPNIYKLLFLIGPQKMDNVKIEYEQPMIIKGFERRQTKKSPVLFPPSSH